MRYGAAGYVGVCCGVVSCGEGVTFAVFYANVTLFSMVAAVKDVAAHKNNAIGAV